MNSKNGLSLWKVISIGLITEFTLVAFQFLSLKVYLLSRPDTAFSFSAEYMRTIGFYIFLIAGFFLYLFVVSNVISKISEGIIRKLLALVIVAAACEGIFYLTISAPFEMIFAYSIFSKVIATAFGVVLFRVSHDGLRKPDESYL